MNKAQFVDAMAENAGIDKKSAQKAFDAFFETVAKGVKEDGKITIPGIVTIKRKDKPASKGRNPKTGGEIEIAAKTIVEIKAADAFNKSTFGG